MRQHCRLTCSNTSLCIYLLAVGLFTICNLLAMVLIQKHMKGKEDGPESDEMAHKSGREVSTEDPSSPSSRSLLIGELLSNFIFNFNRSASRTDARRTYFIHDAVVIGNAWSGQLEQPNGYVTLATQCSVDRLHWLLEVSESWKAPMSIAVFVPGVDFYIAKVYIAYLRLCSQVIRTNATFHFLYHRDMAPSESVSYPKHSVPSCSMSSETLPLLLRYRTSSFKRWWLQALHPQNHLRNVARKGCKTIYHFLTDIDIIPVSGLAEELNVFLGSKHARACSKCVYVVPTYEMPEKLPVPHSKAELLERVSRRQSRPFHAKVFIHNQYATNHSLWEKMPDPGHLQAAYRITNYEFFYEPFYVSKSNVPLHDERFIGYGFTRNTQVFEMHLAGFDFWVLNPAFAIHRGIQSKRGRGAWRERQNIMNRKQFIRFKHEITQKYRLSPHKRS